MSVRGGVHPSRCASCWASAGAGLLAHALYSVGDVGKPGLSGFFDDWVYNGVVHGCSRRMPAARDSRAEGARGLAARGRRTRALAGGRPLLDAEDLEACRRSRIHRWQMRSTSRATRCCTPGSRCLHAHALRNSDRAVWLDGLIGATAVAAGALLFLEPGPGREHRGNVHDRRREPRLPARRRDPPVARRRCDRPRRLAGRRRLGRAGGRLRDHRDRGRDLPAAGGDHRFRERSLAGHDVAGRCAVASRWPLGPPAARIDPRSSSRGASSSCPALFALAAIAIQMYDHFEHVSGRRPSGFGRDHAAVRGAHVDLLRALRQAVAPLPDRGTDRSAHGTWQPPGPDGGADAGLERRDTRLLALFDLDGFKSYNDGFGHPAGDALLVRLGTKLSAAVEPDGRAFRLGGDEFCVLAALDRTPRDDMLAAASRGPLRGRRGVCHHQLARRRDAASTRRTMRARRCASWTGACTRRRARATARPSTRARTSCCARCTSASRIWARTPKASRPGRPAGAQPGAVGRGHRRDRARRAAARHRQDGDPGCGAQQARSARRARVGPGARTHADGRAHRGLGAGAVPRRHGWCAQATSAGTVRATRTAWRARQIPLGARIIAICDAFEAMIEDRPWQACRPPGAALEELRRCAGTQFDPELVEIFAERVFPAAADRDTASAPVSGRPIEV